MYELLRILFTTLFSIVFRWQIIGAENIPPGGVIIAANHISLWDPPVIGSALSRRIHFMAKEELFTNRIFSWIITKLGAFPVKRGTADRTAIRTALTILEKGAVLGIFPEGTRSKNGKLGNPEPGLALLALKAGVPIIPTAVIGTNKVFSNGCLLPRFKVIFGNPIILSRSETVKESMEAMSSKVMTEIGNLLERADADKPV
ncbi:lysophospholipid acyltransferase family protein [Sporomusa acidovorans]|uniref:1-acyl-sn-glycerol-3-phosphate acyltransferase n=1 Tax=Sporomusa acidovorans (strain ATCC 49682 / DSM 3132 / Mol) TaxID=1123286 RepID=A0ABZ3J3J7_SPOA4|nr:lysophospholipid acyltransferase family protein [Sporomusa acidovorans]OZC20310.1 1-acyl-sn-glycerol-3-phosphate acyltransferase [Sporomusa acidovorans DSM 3132]SDD38373.1 1-acyl-sn-glycerol-3-phosphate acyltransferase [Sporomusa acidovorans]